MKEQHPTDLRTHAHKIPTAGHAHEKSDAPVRTIIVGVAGLVLGCLVVYLVVSTMWHMWAKSEPGPPRIPYSYGVLTDPPPSPRLQVTPYLDWDRYRQDEMRTLNTYGWVDQ